MRAPRLLPVAIWLGLVAAEAPARAQSLVIDSLAGPVTRNEVGAFKAFMAKRLPPPFPWGTSDTDHNALGDGAPGTDVESMGLMFDTTHDVAILDRMLFFCDAFLAMRNDLPGGQHRMMWTGLVEKVWLPNQGEHRGPETFRHDRRVFAKGACVNRATRRAQAARSAGWDGDARSRHPATRGESPLHATPQSGPHPYPVAVRLPARAG
jgi:hypothetical protein